MSPAFAFALGVFYALGTEAFAIVAVVAERKSQRVAYGLMAVGFAALAVIRFLDLLRP